jgi:ubiquinone biosynthesis protein COQ9
MNAERQSPRREREDKRDRLLEASLAHIPFDGWSRRSLYAGAADLGFEPSLARRLFPRGGDDLLSHFEVWADRRMIDMSDEAALDAMRIQDRIRTLVRTRLEIMAPHREAIRRANAARLLPGNALRAGSALWRTLDLIWTLAGDRSADSSYYTKRALLGAVWTSTFLYWLDDHSPGQEESWAFLDRRVGDVMQVGRLRGRIESMAKSINRLNPLAARS